MVLGQDEGEPSPVQTPSETGPCNCSGELEQRIGAWDFAEHIQAGADKGVQTMTHRYLIVVEKADGNYSAYSPDIPGCVAVGDTPEEVVRNMREAIVFHVQGLIEDSLPVPEPRTTAKYLAVQV